MEGVSVPQESKFKLTLPIAILLGACVIAGAIVLTRTPAAGAAEDGSTHLAVRAATSEDHIIGSPDAPVTIVEYADFQCPYCSVIYPTLKKIVADNNGKVAWVYRNFPLSSIHPQADPAAQAAECVAGLLGNDAFWKFADADFANQGSLNDTFYAATARQLGVDPSTFAKCVASKKYDDRIQADTAEALSSGGQGTPFSIVIGKDGTEIPFSGALPEAQIAAIVKAVLSKQK